MSYLIRVGDALSQLANVIFIAGDTTADESISRRAHRCEWKRTERFIDWLASPFEKDHCRVAYDNDVQRAHDLVEYDNARKARR